jgi:hypothetical protein
MFNKAYVGVEVSGGYGWPFVSFLAQRLHLSGISLYERVAYDRRGGVKVKVKRPGWDTNTKTRPILVAITKQMVRSETCVIRSQTTIAECQTLWSNPDRGEKVEARPGYHDDGWMAYGIACHLRNEKSGYVSEEMVEEKKRHALFAFVDKETEEKKRYENNRFARMNLREVVPAMAVGAETTKGGGPWL